MGKYDIGTEFDENIKISLADLCDEILSELYPIDKPDSQEKSIKEADESIVTKEGINRQFGNSHRTGLLDKLQDKLGFDMRKIAGKSKRELFDMYKILKLLYCIEKSKSADSSDILKITDLLAKPRLANVSNGDSEHKFNGGTLKNLFEQIKGAVEDADRRCAKLKEADAFWDLSPSKHLIMCYPTKP